MNHMFSVEAATKYGVTEAILLEGLSFWCRANEANGRNIHGGLAYTYNSIKALHELYPYLSEKKIRGALMNLEKEGLIVTGCFNKTPYDRTKWYAVTEKGFSESGASILRKGQINFHESENENTKNGGPIPVVSTVQSPPVSHSEGEAHARSEADEVAIEVMPRHRYGEYQNVLLSDSELEKLKAEFPTDWEQRIERLSEYIASTGKRYKSHLATIRSWARKDKQGQSPSDPRGKPPYEGMIWKDGRWTFDDVYSTL